MDLVAAIGIHYITTALPAEKPHRNYSFAESRTLIFFFFVYTIASIMDPSGHSRVKAYNTFVKAYKTFERLNFKEII